MTQQVEAAREALAAKDRAQQDLARLASCPPWRHALFGGIMAGLVGTPAVPLPWRFVLLAAVFATLALVVQSDRRRMGVFVNGYRPGRTRLVTFPILALFLALYAGSYAAVLAWHRPEIAIALAIAAFVMGCIGSVLWQRVFVRELGA